MSADLRELLVPAMATVILMGTAPGFMLRLLVRTYPKNDPRRQELVAELYTIPYKDRLLFVAQQLELSVTEGIPSRWHQRGLARVVRNKHQVAAVGYRGPDVCRIVGITYRQLDYWARTDLIRPSIAEGTGTQREYSYRDLVDLKVIKSLLDAGVSLASARRAIGFLRGALGEDVASSALVLNGPGSVLVRNDGELVDLMRDGQGVFSIVALNGVTEELDSAITGLQPPDAAAASSARNSSARKRRSRFHWWRSNGG